MNNARSSTQHGTGSDAPSSSVHTPKSLEPAPAQRHAPSSSRKGKKKKKKSPAVFTYVFGLT